MPTFVTAHGEIEETLFGIGGQFAQYPHQQHFNIHTDIGTYKSPNSDDKVGDIITEGLPHPTSDISPHRHESSSLPSPDVINNEATSCYIFPTNFNKLVHSRESSYDFTFEVHVPASQPSDQYLDLLESPSGHTSYSQNSEANQHEKAAPISDSNSDLQSMSYLQQLGVRITCNEEGNLHILPRS